MIEKHIYKLIEIGNEKDGYLGNNSLKWSNLVIGEAAEIDKKLDTRFDRYELFD